MQTCWTGLKGTRRDTYEVGRVQDAVLHRVGQVQGELPHSSLSGLLASCWSLLFDLRWNHGDVIRRFTSPLRVPPVINTRAPIEEPDLQPNGKFGLVLRISDSLF